MDSKLTAPLSTLRWVDRNLLKPNDYNPNKVSKENLKLLIQSILTNGWTLPIVVRPDMTIIDGFHRWTVAGMEPLLSKLDGKVPIVIVEHKEHSEDIYGTVTHNRARSNGMIKILLSKKLGELRLTQADLARATGIRPNTINELYHELTERVNLEHLDLICEALNCELDELIIRVPNKETSVAHTRQGTLKPNKKM